MANDVDEAIRVAVENCEAKDAEAHPANTVAHEWYNAVPFNAEDNSTCGEILAEELMRRCARIWDKP